MGHAFTCSKVIEVTGSRIQSLDNIILIFVVKIIHELDDLFRSSIKIYRATMRLK